MFVNPAFTLFLYVFDIIHNALTSFIMSGSLFVAIILGTAPAFVFSLHAETLSLIEANAETSKYRCTRTVCATVVWLHSAVNMIEDVVNPQFGMIRKRLAVTSKIVGGIDSPKLEGLAVSIVLIHALATASGAEIGSKLI